MLRASAATRAEWLRVYGGREGADGSEVQLAHPRQRFGVLEGGRHEVREGLQNGDVLVVEGVLCSRLAREHAEQLAAALDRHEGAVGRAVRLRREDDMAQGIGP